MDCQLLWESKSVASLFDPEARGAQSVQWRLRYPDMRGAIEQGVRASGELSVTSAHPTACVLLWHRRARFTCSHPCKPLFHPLSHPSPRSAPVT